MRIYGPAPVHSFKHFLFVDIRLPLSGSASTPIILPAERASKPSITRHCRSRSQLKFDSIEIPDIMKRNKHLQTVGHYRLNMFGLHMKKPDRCLLKEHFPYGLMYLKLLLERSSREFKAAGLLYAQTRSP